MQNYAKSLKQVLEEIKNLELFNANLGIELGEVLDNEEFGLKICRIAIRLERQILV